MVAKDRRREVARAYKERPPALGVFAVRCAATGETWVAASRHLDTQQNGLWFQLRAGGHMNKPLQAAWIQHGEAAFAYEVLETLPDQDLPAFAVASRLREREAHWIEALGARKALG